MLAFIFKLCRTLRHVFFNSRDFSRKETTSISKCDFLHLQNGFKSFWPPQNLCMGRGNNKISIYNSKIENQRSCRQILLQTKLLVVGLQNFHSWILVFVFKKGLWRPQTHLQWSVCEKQEVTTLYGLNSALEIDSIPRAYFAVCVRLLFGFAFFARSLTNCVGEGR